LVPARGKRWPVRVFPPWALGGGGLFPRNQCRFDVDPCITVARGGDAGSLCWLGRGSKGQVNVERIGGIVRGEWDRGRVAALEVGLVKIRTASKAGKLRRGEHARQVFFRPAVMGVPMTDPQPRVGRVGLRRLGRGEGRRLEGRRMRHGNTKPLEHGLLLRHCLAARGGWAGENLAR